MDAVADKAATRIHRVIRAMITHPRQSHPFWGFAVDALSPIVDRQLKSYVRETIATELQKTRPVISPPIRSAALRSD